MNLFSRIVSRNYSLIENTTQKICDINLVGRDYLCPTSLTSTELKSLLWTAIDLKHVSKQRALNNPTVQGARVSILLEESCIKTQLPINAASKLLNISSNIIVNSDWRKENMFENDIGKIFATSSDIILCNIKDQKTIERIADGANVPVVTIASSSFNLVKALADLMTIYLHFNRLNCLTLAWIGKSEPLFNTYLHFLPQLKMNLKYCLVETYQNHPFLESGHKLSQMFNTEMHEFLNAPDTIQRSDIIVTSAHNYKEFQVTLNDTKTAALNWAFLHALPRGEFDVQKEVFAHKNSLVWKSLKNMQWIYAAIIVRLLTSYTHATDVPKFNPDDIVITPVLFKKPK